MLNNSPESINRSYMELIVEKITIPEGIINSSTEITLLIETDNLNSKLIAPIEMLF